MPGDPQTGMVLHFVRGKRAMCKVRVGTCGPRPGVAAKPDPFDVVELTRTFDRPPPLATAQQWRASAPEGFIFTLRADRSITHPHPTPTGPRRGKTVTIGFQDTPQVRKAWKTTLEIARALEAPLIIFDCPESFTPIAENVNNLTSFVQWAHRDRIKFGWEPRGAAWADDLVRHLCRELSLTHVVDPFERTPTRGRPPYLRLRGAGQTQRARRKHIYTDQELTQLRELCMPDPSVTPQPEEVFCVFNTQAMANDARRFAALLRADATTVDNAAKT